MKFNKDIQTTKIFWKGLPNNSGMLLELPENWQPSNSFGEHEGLWRTSYGYIIWNEPYMKQSILDCFEFNGDKVIKVYRQADRLDKGLTTSRDAVIMAFSALLLNNDIDELKRILNGLNWKLSDKFNMSLPMKLWTKGMFSKFWSNVFNTVGLIESFLSISFNRILNKILKFDKIDSIVSWKQPGFNDYKKWLYTAYYSDYAYHLQVWTVGTSKDSFMKKVHQKFLLGYCERQNFILRYLLNDKSLTISEIDEYIKNEFISSNDVQAQRRFDGSSNIHLHPLSDEEKEYNDINLQILEFVKYKLLI